jgi:hypothetical protein
MPAQALFGASVAFGFVAWGVVTALYIWPELRARSRIAALKPLLVLHSFRFEGLCFLIPGVVSPELPANFARDAAFGDLTAAILALLLNAFYQGDAGRLLPGQLGAAYFIPTTFVPLLLITHGLVFRILLRGPAPARSAA